jgi:N-acetylmuramoyl-L-alanine amidase
MVRTQREGENGYKVSLVLKNLSPRTIFLDVGHGGYDPGGVGPGGLPESFVNLDVAERLKSILTRSGFRVALDRTTNAYVSLPDRVTMADESGADLFLGLYCNASSDRSIHGTTTYYFHPGAEAFARELENQVAGSLHLANDGVMKDNLYVIRHTTATIPDVLIEYAYISNYREQSLLGSPAFRQRIAVALGKAITDYFAGPSASVARRAVPSGSKSAAAPVPLPVLPQLPDPVPAQPARISSFRASNGAVSIDATGPPPIDTFSMKRHGTNYYVVNLEDAVLAGAQRRIAVGPPFSGTATIDQFSTSPDVVRIAVREQFENSYRVESVPQAGGRVSITVYPIDN